MASANDYRPSHQAIEQRHHSFDDCKGACGFTLRTRPPFRLSGIGAGVTGRG